MIQLLAVALFAQTSIGIRIGDKPDSTKRARAEAVADSIADFRASKRDSIRAHRKERDSTRTDRRRARTIAVTPTHLATAYRDVRARTLFHGAREARMKHDSALLGYDASAYERISVGVGFKRIGRERILFRSERASRVVWKRGQGAYVEVRGKRTAFPALAGIGGVETDLGGESAIPYYPGRETLWIGSGLAKADVEDMELMNPLAGGAEAYYTYGVGDSVSFRLPGGKVVQLRELLVRPRKPQWNLAVGSLWFDVSTSQLVRAVYRMAEPLDIWAIAKEEAKLDGEADPEDDVPRWVRPMLNPMKAQVRAITVEYGLHENRFWLPRAQAIEGDAQFSFVKVPFRMEKTFKYASVNGESPLPATVTAADTASDSVSRSRRRVARREECSSTGGQASRRRAVSRYDGALQIIVATSCDTAALARSADLPKSIFEENNEVFGSAEREELIAQALSIAAQPGFAPQKPEVHFGLDLTRYNRVEGFSSGVELKQKLGAGYAARAVARIGHADLAPNGELSLSRSDQRRSYSLGLYRRLDFANDWGNPLGFSSSISALLFGRDEGFYYRSSGMELTGTSDSTRGSWRIFGERHGDARVNTEFSLANAFSDRGFTPNIDARNGNVAGAAFTRYLARGLDPHALRLYGAVRGEAAGGDFDYARGMFDLTLSNGITRRIDGALTVGAGYSGGALPAQRLWYLGGTQSVRGQRAGAAIGNAFWMSRLEFGSSFVGARPIVFGDIGWAGDRDSVGSPGRPISGAGVGASFLDGLIRFDVAKGIYPEKKFRSSLYVEARF